MADNVENRFDSEELGIIRKALREGTSLLLLEARDIEAVLDDLEHAALMAERLFWVLNDLEEGLIAIRPSSDKQRMALRKALEIYYEYRDREYGRTLREARLLDLPASSAPPEEGVSLQK